MIRRTLKVEKDALLAQVRLHNVQLERLARVMAHDLLTPVTVAFGSVETAVLLIDHGQVDSAKLHLQTAHRRLLELTDQMQNVLDETIKGSSVGSYAVDVAPAAELAYASLSPESRDRLHLVTDAGPAVSALPGTLRQVFQNLLSNAAAHNPDDVTVTVASHQVGEWVVVTVQDNGIGWRDDPTLLAVEGTSTAGSTGLGLVTVRHAIEGLGGSVVFGNSDLGGARIDLRLPAPQPDHELEPAVPAIG